MTTQFHYFNSVAEHNRINKNQNTDQLESRNKYQQTIQRLQLKHDYEKL